MNRLLNYAYEAMALLNESSHAREAEEILRRHGFRNIGSGCESEVYEGDRFAGAVIKIVSSPHYGVNNFYDRKKDADEYPDFFACFEFFFHNGFVVMIQEMAEEVISYDEECYDWEVEEASDFLKSIGARDFDACGNMGRLEGRVVAIDWISS